MGTPVSKRIPSLGRPPPPPPLTLHGTLVHPCTPAPSPSRLLRSRTFQNFVLAIAVYSCVLSMFFIFNGWVLPIQTISTRFSVSVHNRRSNCSSALEENDFLILDTDRLVHRRVVFSRRQPRVRTIHAASDAMCLNILACPLTRACCGYLSARNARC